MLAKLVKEFKAKPMLFKLTQLINAVKAICNELTPWIALGAAIITKSKVSNADFILILLYALYYVTNRK